MRPTRQQGTWSLEEKLAGLLVQYTHALLGSCGSRNSFDARRGACVFSFCSALYPAVSMYHIEINIHSDGASHAPPYVDTSAALPVVSSDAHTKNTGASQAPLSPRVTTYLTPDSLLYQKGQGLCCHFSSCGHLKGRNTTHITEYNVCQCLPALHMSRSEKTPVWADDRRCLHATVSCHLFHGNLKTSLTPCKDCFRPT